ncbi:hypothetical protein N7468_001066 [Penicillium chermesinum]|uniref:Restriction of telomere capping protein 4 n=1 Tax=Penicillium chermesinum TaxID=63820 RepID=A0A9W9TWZ5_9EURO|nr:uncharacterized protein N7468_001066 [Penicillium chermesinum]KAJ5246083.1 hypothetical protein N7468_001066 [Penicillium chermesinum]KAJ6144376.1 hypothetical protein N7470_008271 [Penicillium chermesinum]
MGPRQRSAAEASNQLSRNLPGNKHLLSSFNKEEDINRPPSSSDEDESDREGQGEDSDLPTYSFKQQDSSHDQRLRSHARDGSNARKPLARTSSKMEESDDDDIFFGGMGSQSKAKRLKHHYDKPTRVRVPKAYPLSAQEKYTKIKNNGRTPEKGAKNDELEESEEEMQFKMPASMEEFEQQPPPFKVPPSSAPSSLLDELSSSEPEAPAVCPMCKAEVDPKLLKKFQAQPNQRIRQQREFCASHRNDSAAGDYKAQGYPEIHWETFGERVQQFFPALEKLVKPDAPSYYRNLLDTAQKAGKTLQPSLEGDDIERISCGYYGPKGGQKMLDAIMGRFAVSLRRLAKQDSLVTKTGVVRYAQSVLVPELTVLLIKDDMDVSEDAAREIMRDSIDIGLMVNAQVDIVPIDEPALSEASGSELSEEPSDEDEFVE